MPASAAVRQHSRTLAIAAAAVPLALAVLADDVRVRRQLQVARRDPLTGLPGRDILIDRTARLARTYRAYLHVLVADVDGLKAVKDTLGHAAGDALIAATGRRLDQWTADRGGLAARLGGDEFGVALLLPLTTAAVREVLALRALLAQPVDHDGQPCATLRGGSCGRPCPSAPAAPATCRRRPMLPGSCVVRTGPWISLICSLSSTSRRRRPHGSRSARRQR
ncbi:GGDEF domain-containing protein [Streptomyces sp. NPDC050704]|uniref:GGDEF domain-containing protein n=1 Tax=Streptomyces sp. NPDC050704 TaxID=3157219 RepID=UPI00342FB1F4